jgi:hypothetical protein
MHEHPGDDLQRLLDGLLDAERAAQVEAHVAGCARCQRELEAVRQVKSALRQHLPSVPVPDTVAARARAAALGTVPLRRRFPPRVGVAAAVVLALAALVVLAIVRTRPGAPDVVHAVAADFRDYRSGTMALQRTTAVAAELDQFFQQAGVPFPTPVFEFDVMGYSLTGGTVREDGGVRALFAYQSATGDRMICEMYEGVATDLPVASDVREYKGVTFHVYRMGELTLVFWQDGAVVCVLVSDGDPEQAIVFARAKAGAA